MMSDFILEWKKKKVKKSLRMWSRPQKAKETEKKDLDLFFFVYYIVVLFKLSFLI